MKKYLAIFILLAGCSNFLQPEAMNQIPKIIECMDVAQRCFENIDKAKADSNPDTLVWTTAQCATEWATEGCSQVIERIKQ